MSPENLILKARAKAPVREMLVGLSLLIAACISVVLTRAPGGIALLWPGSALAAAMLIRLPRVRWSSAVFALIGAMLLTNAIVGHRPWGLSAVFISINLTEIALMIAAFRFAWRFPYPHITISQAAVMTVIFGIVIPGITACAGGLVLNAAFATPWREGTLQWWSSHTIGACLLGPPIILFSVKGVKRLLRPQYLIQNLATFVACLIGCYLTICYVRFPFVSMGLLLLVAAFRLGGFGASLMSLAFGLLITNLWICGIRPMGLDPHGVIDGTLLGLPVIAFLATVIPPIAVGLGSDSRRAAAWALRISERRFRESMEYSPIGMLISDLNGVWGYTNIALQKMLGYTAAEFRAMPPGGPSKSDDWRDSGSRWRRLLSGELESYDVARVFRHKLGHWVWTHVAVSVLRDEDGSPLHLIAQVESLEAHRLAEATIAAERERLKITLQSINDAVITTDANTRITYINAAAESLLGLTLAAAEDRRIGEVIHLMDPHSSKAAANLIGQSALHGEVFRREQACILHRPDGSFCYVTDVVSPVMDTAGVLSGLVIVLRDASKDVDRGRELQHRATHDPLTGLCNRLDFNERLSSAFMKAAHLGTSAAVIAIDLDRFKAVNDTGGHAAGDAVLCKVAEACRHAVRSSDTVARLGGDEFAVILENCADERAYRIGQKILRALNPLDVEWEGAQYSVNASIGLAMCTAALPDEKAWMELADSACYLAKREGRGRLRVASAGNGGHEAALGVAAKARSN